RRCRAIHSGAKTTDLRLQRLSQRARCRRSFARDPQDAWSKKTVNVQFAKEKEQTVMIKTILLVISVAGLAWAAGDAAAGKAVYDKACRSCHGADGAGNANIAKMMKVEMESLASAGVQARSDADLKKVIEEGKGK